MNSRNHNNQHFDQQQLSAGDIPSRPRLVLEGAVPSAQAVKVLEGDQHSNRRRSRPKNVNE